ncbi:MAG: type II toxin-antitoxin system RelE/ParE family toxin [Niabella sp.]|nr:type II toxin-antitoxin system RelE/ParE family toxin [Niabella sp.]
MRKGYYRSKVKAHFIFYKINVKQDELEIIRILHQQMDIDSRLND